MTNRFLAAAVLLGCACALPAETKYYQIDLIPSGKVISTDAPVAKGGMVIFHDYPSGNLVSMRKSTIQKVTQISTKSAQATNLAEQVIPIGNLAMQGGSAQAGPTNVRAIGAAKAAGGLGGTGFYSNVVPGQTIGDPNSANDYQVGRTFAGPPPNAVQSSPGAPPQAPQNPNQQ